MRFLLDESAEFRIAAFLEDLGHDVTAIARDYPASLQDDQVLAIAATEQRCVITNDTDFGELVVRQRRRHCGVLLFRLPSGGTQAKIRRLQDVLSRYSNELDQFIVVDRRRIRVRRDSGASRPSGH